MFAKQKLLPDWYKVMCTADIQALLSTAELLGFVLQWDSEYQRCIVLYPNGAVMDYIMYVGADSFHVVPKVPRVCIANVRRLWQGLPFEVDDKGGVTELWHPHIGYGQYAWFDGVLKLRSTRVMLSGVLHGDLLDAYPIQVLDAVQAVCSATSNVALEFNHDLHNLQLRYTDRADRCLLDVTPQYTLIHTPQCPNINDILHKHLKGYLSC